MYLQAAKADFHIAHWVFCFQAWGNTHHPEYQRMGILITLNNLFQMKPTRCTLLLGIFISTSLHVWGNYVPIIKRTRCIYATLVFFVLCGWLSGLPPIQNKDTSVA